MAQLPLGPRLGRSILTPKPPKPMPSAIRDGNWYPVECGHGTTTSASSDSRPQYVAPTAKMISSAPHNNDAEPIPRAGKGKERAIAPFPEQISGSDIVNDGRGERVRPVLESDITSDSEEQSLADARRYQAQVDRSERRRDREDADFDPLDDSQKQHDYYLRDPPRTRSRRVTKSKAAGTPPGQRSVGQREQVNEPRTSIERNQSVPEKRKADFESPLEHIQHSSNEAGKISSRPHNATNADSEPEHHKRYTSERHHNKQFTKLKPDSQSKRKQYVRSILQRWKISSEQLMTFPYAPRRTAVLKPLDWNSGLLEAVAQLALNTKGNYSKGCEFARDALERSLPKGTKQMTAKVLLNAINEQETASGHRLEPNGTISALQPMIDGRQGVTGEHSNARSKTFPEQPPSPASSTVQSSSTTGQAPPSPAASPVAAPASLPANAVKSEPSDPIARQDVQMQSGSQSSAAEERLDLESRAKILSYELAIVRERMKLNDRRKRERERRGARSGQPGGSVSQPLVL